MKIHAFGSISIFFHKIRHDQLYWFHMGEKKRLFSIVLVFLFDQPLSPPSLICSVIDQAGYFSFFILGLHMTQYRK